MKMIPWTGQAIHNMQICNVHWKGSGVNARFNKAERCYEYMKDIDGHVWGKIPMTEAVLHMIDVSDKTTDELHEENRFRQMAFHLERIEQAIQSQEDSVCQLKELLDTELE